MDYIYLFECVSNWETTYKIGFTKNKNFNTRIKTLQTGNSDIIKCIDYFETTHGRSVEIAMHNYFSEKRKSGEWFYLDLTDIVNFKILCEKIENNLNIINNDDIF